MLRQDRLHIAVKAELPSIFGFFPGILLAAESHQVQEKDQAAKDLTPRE